MTVTTPARAARPAPMMAIEAAKQFRRPRTAAVIGAAVAVELAVCGLLAGTGNGQPERLGDWGSVVPRATGFALPLVALNAVTVLAFPVIASIYAGDAVAGEAGSGALRYLAARPIARWRVLTAKTGVAAILTVATMAAAFAAALVVGLVFFGWHPLAVVDLQHSTAFHLSAASFDPGTALVRSAAILGVVLASTASVFAFSLLLSVLTDQAFAAVAGGAGLAFVSRALDNIPGLHALSPWLPVTDASTTAWTGLLDKPAVAGPIAHLFIAQAVYLAALSVAAFVVFTKKDLLA